jgi:hypothetical protein
VIFQFVPINFFNIVLKEWVIINVYIFSVLSVFYLIYLI